MNKNLAPFQKLDPIWAQIRDDAQKIANTEPILSGFIHDRVLHRSGLEEMLTTHLAERLANRDLGARALAEIFAEVFAENTSLAPDIRADIAAIVERDPACQNYLDAVLYYKGFLALTLYRIAHHLLGTHNRRAFALYLQSRISEAFQVDVHPAATIGHGVFIDHATGVVIGETARIGNNVSILHGVTLGGTGKSEGDRHPKIGDGVLISVGAQILGNLEIGTCAKIGAGSVVLADVPPYATAVGVPAKIIAQKQVDSPARDMEHRFIDNI